MKTIVPIFSGGLDSTVLLYSLLSQGYNVKPLSVDYGQKHRKELMYAAATCGKLLLKHEVADLRGITKLINNSSQTSDMDVPEGHYAAESMKQTVVPNRNMIMLAVAGGYAINIKADEIAYGAHAGDHTVYPDCRDEFVNPLSEALWFADWHQVSIVRPFLFVTKADIVKLGDTLDVPFEETWSCYKGGEFHCGRCGTCVERREAFELSGVKDPTLYEYAQSLSRNVVENHDSPEETKSLV